MWHCSVIFNMTQTQEQWRTHRINKLFMVLFYSTNHQTHSPLHTHTHRVWPAHQELSVEPHYISMLTPFKQAHTNTHTDGAAIGREIRGLAHRLWHVDWMSLGSNLYIIWQTTPPPGHCSAQEQGWWFRKVWIHQDKRLLRTLESSTSDCKLWFLLSCKGEFSELSAVFSLHFCFGSVHWVPGWWKKWPDDVLCFCQWKMKKVKWISSTSYVAYVTKPLIEFMFSSQLCCWWWCKNYSNLQL